MAALRSACRADLPAEMIEFCIGHAYRQAEISRESPLEVLQEGDLERSIALCEQRDAREQVLLLLLLWWDLLDRARFADAARIEHELLTNTLPRLSWHDDELAAICLRGIGIHTALPLTLVQAIGGDATKREAVQHFQQDLQFEHAVAVARSIEDGSWQAIAFGEIAEALAGAGQTEQALAVARSIQDDSRQAPPLRRISQELAKAGKSEQALAVARSIEDGFWQAIAFGEIAEALAGAGQTEQALAVARSIQEPSGQAHALGEIAEALAGAGQTEQALAVARSIQDDSRQARPLQKIAQALAGAGKWEQALAAARSSRTRSGEPMPLREIAEKALAKKGEWQQALAAARSIGDREVTKIVWALAGAGEWEQALEVARSIKNEFEALKALRHHAGGGRPAEWAELRPLHPVRLGPSRGPGEDRRGSGRGGPGRAGRPDAFKQALEVAHSIQNASEQPRGPAGDRQGAGRGGPGRPGLGGRPFHQNLHQPGG